MEKSRDGDSATLISKEDVHKILNSHADAICYLLTTEFDRLLYELKMEKIPLDKFVYICALSTLALCGMDMDKENVIKLLISVDIIPDENLVDKFAGFKLKNYLIYVHALYFMIDSGTEPTTEGLVRIVRNLDVYPDAKLANIVIDFYNQKGIGPRLLPYTAPKG
jgi:hypothetical protein